MQLSPVVCEAIAETLTRLRQLTQFNVQSAWRQHLGSLNNHAVADFSAWHKAQPNEKGYLVWASGRQECWLAQKITIPTEPHYSLSGLTLRLCLTWWAELAQIFVNGELVQEGDLFDSSARVVLTPYAVPGQEITVMLRLISPGHDIGALMRSHCIYEASNPSHIDPCQIANEIEVLYKYIEAFEPQQLDSLREILTKIDWDCLGNSEKFNLSLTNLRSYLCPLAEPIKQRCFKMLGHAHLDLAWLWTVEETWEVAQRTFESVLSLQRDFPYLTFCHTSPALYDWIEKNRPELFSEIQEAVNAGRWEVLGGMWVEPEVNLVSGESLVRQLLYGQRYFQEKFGVVSPICWLPDSFGFPWQLPQILEQSGIEYFVTQKLHWNDSTAFPYGAFQWQSPNGSQILSLMSPPNVTGVMDTNPITMTNYAVNWEKQTGLQDIFWLPGVGDHGGGPSRDMLEVQERWQESPCFPRLEFTTAQKFLQNIEEEDKNEIPVWNDELYLEFHRGCYTTHADQKYWNRRCEEKLYQAELFATLASLCCAMPYSGLEIETAWKQVLFNQFHDILPGTSIPEVFVSANQEWLAAAQTADGIVAQSLEAIASCISFPPSPFPNAQPIVIFNSLNWQRSEVVSLNLTPDWQVYDLEGNPLPTQVSAENTLLFLAQDIPSVGYRLFWVSQGIEDTAANEFPDNYILENAFIKVTVNPNTGELSSLYDKVAFREILRGAGNQLQVFADKGQYWDAWNIDPNYEQYSLPSPQLQGIQWLEKGKVRSRLQVIFTLNSSIITQDYILENHSPLLKIATTVDWQEEQVLLKTAFSLNLEADFATYETACSAITRPTAPQTPAEKAKWEVCAHHWADLSDASQDYGVSLLNDCKYGYNATPHQLRLTLLRSPKWPDPQADKGIHSFTYAVYPHTESWQSAKTVHQGYQLNQPLQVCVVTTPSSHSLLPPAGSFLHFGTNNLILMALKPAEDNPKACILRCYECHGDSTHFSLESELNWEIIQRTDLLEQPILTPLMNRVSPWTIASFEIKNRPSS